jgi:lipopolysaccharide transport system permease protein
MQTGTIIVAVKDIAASVARLPLAGLLGWQDVRQRYRRSALGPFWLTASMGVMIGTIGIVFGQLFKAPLSDYLPFLTLGIIIWSFISTVITEGCLGFISSDSIIKQLPLPMFLHIIRLLWRNILIFLHNLLIFPLVFLAVGKSIELTAILTIAGFIIVVANLAWISLILAILCARFRDLTQIVGSVLQVMFYLTPVMWLPALLPDRASAQLLLLNPFYHLIEIFRAPLLGEFPSAINWIATMTMTGAGWIIALVLYGRLKHRIAYWL